LFVAVLDICLKEKNTIDFCALLLAGAFQVYTTPSEEQTQDGLRYQQASFSTQ